MYLKPKPITLIDFAREHLIDKLENAIGHIELLDRFDIEADHDLILKVKEIEVALGWRTIADTKNYLH